MNNHQHLTNLAEKVAGAFKNLTEGLICSMNLALIRISPEQQDLLVWASCWGILVLL